MIMKCYLLFPLLFVLFLTSCNKPSSKADNASVTPLMLVKYSLDGVSYSIVDMSNTPIFSQYCYLSACKTGFGYKSHHLYIAQPPFTLITDITTIDNMEYFVADKQYYFTQNETWPLGNSLEFKYSNCPIGTTGRFIFKDGWLSFSLSTHPDVAYVINFDLSFDERIRSIDDNSIIEEKTFSIMGSIQVSKEYDNNVCDSKYSIYPYYDSIRG